MRLGILGPLVVADDGGQEQSVSAARQRTLLATLLVRANRIVPVDQLVEIVWDGAPPKEAARSVRSYLTRLRHVIGPRVAARILTRDPGYMCQVSEDELDALSFETLGRHAGEALRMGRWPEAARAAAQALDMWRDAPLLDVPSQLLRDEFVPRIEQVRLQTLEVRIEAELSLGNAEGLVSEIRQLTAEHPLRERFHGQLMLALAGAGRQAEALEAYRTARRTLIEQLGIEPGADLRRIHEQVLAGQIEPAPARAAPLPAAAPEKTTAVPAAARPPRQLPAGVGHFTGRTVELDLLLSILDGTGSPVARGGTVVIWAIDGMAGVGKTALAVHAAHRAAERFPNGQLFIDLHGHTQGCAPREPGEALEVLLRCLGVAAQQIPRESDERAALYRQRLADTRTLIVLDNAASEFQVRPLLPGSPGCLVLVTSRRRLKGLDDAYPMALDVLSLPDAVTLLRTVAGPGRVADGDPVLTEMAELCGRLPLAVRIAGALIRHRPAWTLEYLAGRLRDPDRRVQSLSDGERDVATVFDLSYAGLDDQHRRLFRHLGLVPGPDADVYAAAALLDVTPGTAGVLLEDLADSNLLIEHAPGRYRLHDLIRTYARTLAAADPESDRRAALDRLMRYYAYLAQSASLAIARYPRPAPDGPAPANAPVLPDPDAAWAWLRAERENLGAAHARAHALALDGYVIALAAGLAEIMRTDGPFTRALDLHQMAAELAERHGSPAVHATALTDLGVVRRQTGDLVGADVALTRALDIYRTVGHRHGQAAALTELGVVRHLTGDLPAAQDALARALDIYRATNHRHGEANVLIELGVVRRLAGDLSAAQDALTRALGIYRATNHRHGEANALTELGAVRRLTGDLSAAERALDQALVTYRATGNRNGEAYVLTELGRVHFTTGELSRAERALGQALTTYRATGHRNGEATTLTELGHVRRLTGDLLGAVRDLCRALDIFRATGNRNNEAWALNHYAAAVAAGGDPPRALAVYRQALAMNRELHKPDDEAVALEGIGECLLSVGEPSVAEVERAESHLRRALEIFEHLGMAPDADRVRTRLGAARTAHPPPSRRSPGAVRTPP